MMNDKTERRRSVTISNSRWATYAVAGAATSLAGLAAAEADIHYSGPVHFVFKGTIHANFPMDNGASLDFEHIDEGGAGGFAHLAIPDPNGGVFQSIGLFAADGGREQSASGFYLSRIGDNIQVSALPMRASCRSTSNSQILCYGGTIGLETLPGCHFITPGRGFIAFSFDAGAGREFGWARLKTSGAPDYNFILVDYAWADPGTAIATGQKRSQPTAQAVTKPGSLGLLAIGATGLKAWRQQKGSAALP